MGIDLKNGTTATLQQNGERYRAVIQYDLGQLSQDQAKLFLSRCLSALASIERDVYETSPETVKRKVALWETGNGDFKI